MPEGPSPIEDLKSEATQKSKDPQTRRLLIGLLALWLLTLAALLIIAWSAYFSAKDDAKTSAQQSQTLAQQIALACKSGDFGPGFSDEDQSALCSNAKKVIQDQGEIQDDEIQESEIQDPEIQNPEPNDPEIQDPERQDPELQQGEIQEPEIQDPELADNEVQDDEKQDDEIQDPENQDPEIQDDETQDPEIQDPEIDDPDPASPYNFSFNFTVPGNGLGQTDHTYRVTCNSGTGECTVEEA
jgi:hypothetical protein